ncbi:MAG: PIN domain-containing protein [Candidatus Korobacteraceae bacterium]
MTRYVLDASAVLRYVEDGPGAMKVERILQDARNAACEVLISAVNWGEVLYVLRRKLDHRNAAVTTRSLRSLPLLIVDAREADAEAAAEFKERYLIAYADCFAAALARGTRATLITSDFDFKVCQSALSIDFLPALGRTS